jgi:hypothetical protein
MNKLIFIVALVGAIINSSPCIVAQAANNSNRDLSSSSSFSAVKLNKFQRSVQQESDSSSNTTTASDNNETLIEEIETEEEHDDSSANDSCHCDGDVVHCWGGDADGLAYHCHDGVIEKLAEATTATSASDADAHSSDCHCDGDVPHCSDAADEASYDCSSTSQSSYETDCHCDADVVHCTGGISDDYCSCTIDGILECEGFNNIMVDNNIRDVAIDGKPWGEVIITSLIVNLSTLAGVFGTLI